MYDLFWYQYGLIAVLFAWSGFVRSGLGFGGSVFSLPFLLLIINNPVIWLPIISIHLLFFASLTVFQSHAKAIKDGKKNSAAINWHYLRYSLVIMIIPKLIGVFGLVTLDPDLLSSIIFIIIAVYSFTYILDKPFRSSSKGIDALFLMLGGYISGTSLIGAPLIIAVYANHVARHQLRDTLFVVWIILVTIKMTTFIFMGIDLQLIHQFWLLPSAAIGHWIGLKFHQRALQVQPITFYRGLGLLLLFTSIAGLGKITLL